MSPTSYCPDLLFSLLFLYSSLINTLVFSRDPMLVWIGFGLTSKGFGLIFVSGSIQSTMVYPLGLIS